MSVVAWFGSLWERRVEEFMARPTIRDAIAEGKLQIKHARIDTSTDRLVVDIEHHDAH